MLAPAVLRPQYESQLSLDSLPPRFRSDTDNAALAAALGGIAARPADVDVCTPAVVSDCRFVADSVRTMAVAEPIMSGDTARVLMQVGSLSPLGRVRLINGSGTYVIVALLTQNGGVWRLRCTEDLTAADWLAGHSRCGATPRDSVTR